MNNSSCRPEWGACVKQRRERLSLTRHDLAMCAYIDASYITLIERDGYVPRRDKVISLARAMNSDVDEVLLTAGYAPETISANAMIAMVRRAKKKATA